MDRSRVEREGTSKQNRLIFCRDCAPAKTIPRLPGSTGGGAYDRGLDEAAALETLEQVLSADTRTAISWVRISRLSASRSPRLIGARKRRVRTVIARAKT